VIKVGDLVYDYGAFRALNGVNFELPENGIVALVGHNGAGKTTLFKCLSGLLTPTEGYVEIEGERQPWKIKPKIGFLQDFIGVYEELTVKECLEYFGRSYRLSPEKIADRIIALSHSLHLKSFLHKKAGNLSRGMKQRLAIAQSIIHEPKLLLLDEPASGLDPQSRMQLAELFKSLKAQGITLLVSSHILSELDEYADQLLILDQGQIIQGKGMTEDSGRHFRIRILKNPKNIFTDFFQKRERDFIVKEESSQLFHLNALITDDEQMELIQQLTQGGLLEFSEREIGLQENYLRLVSGG
jgi:ABC-2 type transport system ATP-binding protein